MVPIRQQTLRQRFDLLQMKEEETVQHYITRVLAVVNQIRGMGSELKDTNVVLKVMRSLLSRFVHAVTSIEEARYMSKVTLDELSGSPQAHEAKFNQFIERPERHEAFVMQEDARSGRTNWRGRCSGRASDNSRGGDQRPSMQRQQNFNEYSRGGSGAFGRFSRGQRQPRQSFNKKNLQNVQCFRCKKYGYYQSHYWSTQDKNASEAGSSSNVPNPGDYGHLFMVHNGQGLESPSIWLLDSGTSSHMTGRRELFHNLDETLQHKVRLGDDKEINVCGRGSAEIRMFDSKLRLNNGVQYVPSLAHNLLSVGQLNKGGYDVNFSKNYGCIIRDGSTRRNLFRI
ncbi:uncharacterized protein LOC120282847 [Dioscorea cayenensis subsp. rotundata]|uniref:Uncharacterized protein LOC120282847 n=1 Tax=Dioscorea cayennensis subsp. rotundata TaxID=55577 RepID=A0AB40D5S5_DIOCR|nr:uncharacterized protein LOC120282847 [Dioscorea cayenensis subsp. rotundata]